MVGMYKSQLGRRFCNTMRHCLTALGLLLLLKPVHAWNGLGHRVMAKLSFEALSAESIDSLKKIYRTRSIKHAKNRFIYDAIWMDKIKFRDLKYFNHWHYDARALVKGEVKPKPNDKHHVIWAIYQMQAVLQSSKASYREKAFALKCLTHLMADAHQPLHALNYYSVDFKDGDRGGNLYLVQSPYRNLHALWDFAAGYLEKKSVKGKAMITMSKEIKAAYPQDAFSAKAFSVPIESVTAESYNIAKNMAYQIKLHAKPTKTYLKRVKAISKKRLALAAWRLAYFLNATKIS